MEVMQRPSAAGICQIKKQSAGIFVAMVMLRGGYGGLRITECWF
jgi:hypothetical protein